MENPIKMDDLGVPPFKETPKWWFFVGWSDPFAYSAISDHEKKFKIYFSYYVMPKKLKVSH